MTALLSVRGTRPTLPARPARSPASRTSGSATGLGRRRLPWIRIALASLAVVFSLLHLAHDPGGATLEEASPAPGIPSASSSERQTRPEIGPLYALDAPDFARLPRDEVARRSGAGGREDVLRIGRFEAPAPHLQVQVQRSPELGPAMAGFFVETARRASEAGLGVVRSAQPATVATKLGPAEMAEVVLVGASERSCLAFRLHRSEIGLRLGGWLCGAPERLAERMQLACAIEGLTVVPGAEDAGLKALFADAERDRNPACGPGVTSAEADLANVPLAATRAGSASRRNRERTSGVRSASRGQRG
jgi:hypothetical protein